MSMIGMGKGEIASVSHPARGAWIEIPLKPLRLPALGCCRTPQGVRGLKYFRSYLSNSAVQSHPARGAWIEITTFASFGTDPDVAPRKGCVD